ncbi:MAG: hypothetical protein LBD07_01845 [Spirochaetaceae bacterium]|jgi:hypothetical protein|nr:hypothetical protein [Spirochaetaceae bacterium]
MPAGRAWLSSACRFRSESGAANSALKCGCSPRAGYRKSQVIHKEEPAVHSKTGVVHSKSQLVQNGRRECLFKLYSACFERYSGYYRLCSDGGARRQIEHGWRAVLLKSQVVHK